MRDQIAILAVVNLKTPQDNIQKFRSSMSSVLTVSIHSKGKLKVTLVNKKQQGRSHAMEYLGYVKLTL